jgi:alpha-tubulin suppressor-like RCC1 family protein
MGNNAYGKLGIDADPEKLMFSSVPNLIEGIKGVIKVACGKNHTLALTDWGDVYSWG